MCYFLQGPISFPIEEKYRRAGGGKKVSLPQWIFFDSFLYHRCDLMINGVIYIPRGTMFWNFNGSEITLSICPNLVNRVTKLVEAHANWLICEVEEVFIIKTVDVVFCNFFNLKGSWIILYFSLWFIIPVCFTFHR